MLFELKRTLARSAGALSRLRGGGGTSIPGAILLRLDSRAIARLAGELHDGSVIVSATNGKTTTAAMLASVMEQAQLNVVHNRAGANMAGGIASALLEARARNLPPADIGLFEVDEFYVPQVAAQLEPRAILLGNLFRDQLDRYGELEAIADRWAAVVGRSAARLVLNADDPLIADLGRDTPSAVYFGVEDDRLGRGALAHAADSKHCRRCGEAYDYTAIYLGHLGHYSCPGCGAKRPTPEVSARAVTLNGVHGASFSLATPAGTATVELPLPGLYNVYNALGAAALALALGIGLDEIVSGLAKVSPAFGRAETVELDGRELCILLIKNPAGANEVLRTLALEPGDHDVLGVLNDQTADGHDVSWIWDADFEALATRIRQATCSGRRAAELAVRLKYAGVPTDRITIVPNLADALDRAVGEHPGSGTLYALPTYTAMLELRALLVKRGAAASSWALA
jgi:UDP-N-acetylmuramyl tripeptide synthase